MKEENIIGRWYNKLFRPTEGETTFLHKGEIMVVFLIGYLIAVSLWLLVNLGRDYTINLDIPLQIVGQAEGMAFAEQPPGSTRISVSGEGWHLLSLYRNPPNIMIAYDEGIVNISEMIRDQLAGFPELEVQSVDPANIYVAMEPEISKKVPVRPVMDVDLQSQFEIMGNVLVNPDSVTVTGAESIVDTIAYWPTATLRLRNVQERVSRDVLLADRGEQLVVDTSRVRVSFDVTEFTEGEIRVYVRARNIPEGRQIRFNPSVITIRYDVPIEHYSEAQAIVPYEAFVNYTEIEDDTTGFIVPTVRATTDDLDLRLRSFQPRRVSYFRVIED